MSTLQKILQLIPDHWQDILVKAHQFEGYIDRAENFVNDNKTKLDDLIISLFNKLDIDWPRLLASIEKRTVYKKFASVNIDIPGFIAIPDDFDADDSTQLQTLVHEKLDFIKQALSPIEFERLNLSDVFSQLEGIIQSLVDLPSDIDFSDTAAVNEYKNTAIEAIKPQLMALISSVFNVDLDGSGTDGSEPDTNAGSASNSTAASNVSSSIGNGFDKIQALSDELSAVYAESTSQDESNDQNSDEQTLEQQGVVAEILDGIEKLRLALPVLKNQFVGKNIAGIEASELIDIADDLLVLITENVAEVIDMIMAVDWQALDVEGFINEAKAILAHIKSIITSSNLAELYEKISWSSSFTSPIKLMGISNDEAIAQLKAIIATPESINGWDNLDELVPIDLVKLLKDRLEQVFTLLGHIEFFGITSESIKQFIDKITEPFELLFDISDDHDFSDLKANGRLLLDKIMQIATLFMPDLVESEENTTQQGIDETNESGPGGVTDSASGASSQSKKASEPNSVITVIFIAIKKAQLIYDFIQANNLGLSLKNKQGSAASGQQSQSSQLPSSQTQSEQQLEPQSSATSENGNKATSSNTDAAVSPATTSEDSGSVTAENSVANDDVLQALLGNKQTGLISKLENEADQDFILDLISGSLIKNFIEDVLEWSEVAELKSIAQQQFDEIKLMLNLNSSVDSELEPSANNETSESITAPSLSEILALLFNAIELAYKALMLLLQKLIETLIELVFSLMVLSFRLLKFATIPTGELPEFLSERLCPIVEYEIEGENGEVLLMETNESPNILGLLVAMPVSTLTSFLGVSLKKFQTWEVGLS